MNDKNCLYGDNYNYTMCLTDLTRKADLQETKVNDMKTRNVVRMKINFVTGKNGGHLPSSLGSR